MLKTRVLTALLLLVGFLSVVFLLPTEIAAAAFAMLTALAAWEWAGLMKVSSPVRYGFSLAILLSCPLVARAGIAPLLWTLAMAFWVLVPVLLLSNWRLARLGFPIGWLLLLSAWSAMLALLKHSPWSLLLVMVLVWMADIAAYFAGRAWGRRKLAPAISPGKTWEGAIGGVVGVTLAGILAAALYPGTLPWKGVGLALFLLLLTVFSILGDLFESMIKRQAGMKDSGSLLPGHGGVLDRIDSQLSVLPFAALAWYWLG